LVSKKKKKKMWRERREERVGEEGRAERKGEERVDRGGGERVSYRVDNGPGCFVIESNVICSTSISKKMEVERREEVGRGGWKSR
jgi:hypothetical protein